MKRVQHIFMKYKDKYGHPPFFLTDLGNVRFSSTERQYAQSLLRGIRQKMSRRNPISKEHQQKLLTLIDKDNFEDVIFGMDILETLADSPQDVYNVLNDGQPIKYQDFSVNNKNHEKYIRLFTLGLLAGLGDPWALSQTEVELRVKYTHVGLDKLVQTVREEGPYQTTKDTFLKKIPDNIGNLTNLRSLRLDHNQIDFVPNSIGSLINLKELDLGNNNIKQLPESIGNLKSLNIMYANDNKMEELPYSMGNLSKLTYLDVAGNRFTSIPKSFSQLGIVAPLTVVLDDNDPQLSAKQLSVFGKNVFISQEGMYK